MKKISNNSRLDTMPTSTQLGLNATLLKYRYDDLQRFYRGVTCLELGCADGEGTQYLAPIFSKVVAVDGSKRLITEAKKKVTANNVEFITSFFEDLSTDIKFDTVVLFHILEHVDDPVQVLKIAKKFLKKDSVLIIDVPNAKSIHREIGVELGILKSVYELHQGDLSIGHQRVYDLPTLRGDAVKAGLKITAEGGIYLKPFSNEQMKKVADKRTLEAFVELGKKHYQISANIYIVCSLK